MIFAIEAGFIGRSCCFSISTRPEEKSVTKTYSATVGTSLEALLLGFHNSHHDNARHQSCCLGHYLQTNQNLRYDQLNMTHPLLVNFLPDCIYDMFAYLSSELTKYVV